MIEFLTGVLVLATLAYTWLTYQILKANKLNIQVMKEQSLALTRPYIDVFAQPEFAAQLFTLRIRNNGNTAAKNLRLRMDRPFHQFGRKESTRDISRNSAFNDVIASFAPRAEITFNLAQSPTVFGDDADPETTPTRFNITASYEFGDTRVEETTTVDLEPYRNSAVPTDRRLEKLLNSLGEIKKAILETK